MASNNPINKESQSLTLKGDGALGVELMPFGTDPGETKELRFVELEANGDDFVALKAPDTVVNTVVFTLPNSDGTDGQALSTDGDGNLYWATVTSALSLNSLLDVAIPNPVSGDLIYAINDEIFTNAVVGAALGIQPFNANISITSVSETRSENIGMDDNSITNAVLEAIRETTDDIVAAATTTIDLEDGNVFNLSQDTNITTFNFNGSVTGRHSMFTLIRTKDNSGTPRTIAWPASVLWYEGTEPDLTQTANAVDVFVFRTINGGVTWYGFASGLNLN